MMGVEQYTDSMSKKTLALVIIAVVVLLYVAKR